MISKVLHKSGSIIFQHGLIQQLAHYSRLKPSRSVHEILTCSWNSSSKMKNLISTLPKTAASASFNPPLVHISMNNQLVCYSPRNWSLFASECRHNPSLLCFNVALKELSEIKNIINIVSVTDEKLHTRISVIHSLVYGHRVLRGLSQIHLMFLSVRFSIWIFDLAERCVKTHAVRQLPTGDSSVLAFT